MGARQVELFAIDVCDVIIARSIELLKAFRKLWMPKAWYTLIAFFFVQPSGLNEKKKN